MSSGNQSAAGGAAFPPVYSGPSWNVPRVSLPGLFGMQPQFSQEWWYYVGTAYDTKGRAFSLQIEILRDTVAGLFQIGSGITGIGWRDGRESWYLSGQGFGLGAGESALPLLPSVVVPPVSDDAYSARFIPLLEIVGCSGNPSEDIHINLPFPNGWDGWKFEYLAGQSRVGAIGSCYSINAHGQGYKISAASSQSTKSDYRISLTVEDKRGAVMEGISGYVGPEMFSHGKVDAPASYECAQPHLEIQRGGSLTIDGETHAIERGYLWLDRQMIGASGSSSARPASIPGNAEELKSHLTQAFTSSKPLYVGDWMGFVLESGQAIVLTEFWQDSNPQWITGTKTGRPPKNGFGNLYFKLDGKDPSMNGGMGLRPRKSLMGDEWDYDINILNPENPESSPHWHSSVSKNTYATAWQIDFSPRLAAYGLPETLYVFAVSDNCEIVLPSNMGAFFEGAALAYADKERKRLLGHVFVEQMGFN